MFLALSVGAHNLLLVMCDVDEYEKNKLSYHSKEKTPSLIYRTKPQSQSHYKSPILSHAESRATNASPAVSSAGESH